MRSSRQRAMKFPHANQWILGLTLALAALVALARPDERGPARDDFDEPDSAGEFEYQRRAPVRGGVDTVSLYEVAEARVARMSRFASTINRPLPWAQPAARAWFGASVLDAWTPLGPGNIGGRTRVVRFHP